MSVKSNTRRRIKLVGVRLTPLEFLELSKKVDQRNAELKAVTSANGVKPPRTAFFSLQRLLIDAAMQRDIPPVITRAASVDVAILKELAATLGKQGGQLKAWLGGQGQHFAERDKRMVNPLEVVRDPTASERATATQLMVDIKATIDAAQAAIARMTDTTNDRRAA
jgi:hypothetical protein